MKLRVLPLGLLCAALALSPVLVSTQVASANDPAQFNTSTKIKIMLGGDSITQGFDGDYTWRYRLYKEFQRQHRLVDFVGPKKYTYGGADHYAVPTGWDTDHDATGGTRLSIELNNIVQDMAYAKPDVLVALYGTTDLLPRAAGDPDPQVSVANELKAIKDYIQRAREINANVDIVLGEVTTRRIPDANRKAFNNGLHTLATNESNGDGYPDSRVVVADLDFTGWDPNKYTYDRTHPNPVGEALIATKIAQALKTLSVLPQNPAISTKGLRYQPNWMPKIGLSGARIVINWYATKYLNKPQMLRAWIKDLKTGKVGVSGWSRSRSYVSTPRKPGRYQVRIQGRRQAMISPWSKTWTITVRKH